MKSITKIFSILLVLLLFLVLCSLPVAAQKEYRLKGTVLDRDTYAPLAGVKIRIVEGEKFIGERVRTDTTGRFVLYAVAPIRRLYFEHSAYYSKMVKIDSGEVLISVYLQRNLQELAAVDTSLNDTVFLLPEVRIGTVRGFETYRELLQTPAAVVIVGQNDQVRAEENSLLTAYNSQPGIRMEERSPESYRMAIRGSNLLRSSFGVRNVKVYFEGIPLTDARGITPLNLLDPALLDRSEIIKGPAGSMYGAGNGGVINLSSTQLPSNTVYRIQTDAMAGSYGLWRGGVAAGMAIGKNSSIHIQYRHQESEGYREHTASGRDLWGATGRTALGKRQTLSAFVLYSRLNYQIPGGLTLAEMMLDPQQARPENKLQKAAFDSKTLFAGLNYTYQHAAFRAGVAVFGSLSDIENPFTTNYKAEQHSGSGVRIVVGQTFGVGKGIRTLIQAGGEWQGAWIGAKNYGNVGGLRDTLNFSDEIIPQQSLLFLQNEWFLPKKWQISASASWSQQLYSILRTNFDQSSNDSRLAFEPVLSPRLALLKNFGTQTACYGSLSAGFSPPTLDELRSGNNAVNTTLKAEKSLNYEAGIRSMVFNEKLYIDIALFWLHISNAMTRYTDSTNAVVYRNAGSTNNRGIEAALRYSWIKNNAKSKLYLRSWLSYTLNDFVFDKYEDKGIVFSGNQLTGSPKHTLAIGADFGHKIGFYANLTAIYTDRIPLNDANAIYADAYMLLKARLGYKRMFGRQFSLEAFGGADNLLDQQYSLGNDLNAFQERYFQPAPRRNFYGGLKLGWRLVK